jgi:hypothetical protein
VAELDTVGDRRLFRALDMARAASKMPGGSDTTFYEGGRAVALWVSAFEILAHDGRSDLGRGLKLLKSADWRAPKLRTQDRSVISMDVVVAEDSITAPTVVARKEAILALLDGVPVAAHPLLAVHGSIDDQFELEASAPVAERLHGTAMASLIIHGDRNRAEPPLPRRVHVVPVLGAQDGFPSDRLIVDLI